MTRAARRCLGGPHDRDVEFEFKLGGAKSEYNAACSTDTDPHALLRPPEIGGLFFILRDDGEPVSEAP
jgi:hypothetical protein